MKIRLGHLYTVQFGFKQCQLHRFQDGL
jgi:hypothetical protein